MPSLTKVQSGFMEAQGALPLSSGTAAAPGLKFDDHAGTGMFSPSTGEIAFSTSGHSQAVTFKTDGNVGIGTANPSELLHLQSGWTKQILKSTNLNTASSLIFDTHNINTADYLLGQLAGRWNGNDVAYINFEAGADTTNKDDGVITFLTSSSSSTPTEKLRIDSSGRVLQGLTSAKLGFFNDNNAAPVHQIQGDNYYKTAFSIFRDGAGGSGPNFILAKGRGAIVQDNDILGTISFQGHDGTTELIEGASIVTEVDGTPAANNVPSALVFKTNSGTSSTSEKLRIDTSGRITANGVDVNNAWGGGDDLVLGGTGSGTRTGITLVSGSNTDGGIYWSHGTGNNAYAGQIAYNHASDMMSFYTNSTAKFRIDSSGRLLLGTTAAGSNGTADDLVVANNGSASDQAGITIRGGTSGRSQIFFSDGTSGEDEYRGMLRYDHSDNSMQIRTNAAERLRIASDGKIAIGGNYGDTANFGRQVLISGTVGLNNDNGNIGIGFNRGVSNTYGYIGTGAWAINGLDNDDFGIASGSTGDLVLGTGAGTKRLRITNTGGVTIGSGNNDATWTEFGSNVGGLTIDDVGVSHTGLRLSHGNDDTYLVQANNSNFYISQYGTGNMIFGVGSTGQTRLTIGPTGQLTVSNTVSSNDAAVNILKSTGDNTDKAILRVGYDAAACFEAYRLRTDANIYMGATQAGADILISTKPSGTSSSAVAVSVTDGGVVNTRRLATGEMHFSAAYRPHQYGYMGDYFPYGCNAVYYLAQTSAGNSGYSSHMFSWYDSGHWGHYGKFVLFCQEASYIGGFCQRYLSGTSVTTIASGGQLGSVSTAQTQTGSGTHSGQNVHRYDCTVSHSGTYRTMRWYLGLLHGCSLGVTGNGKTQAEAQTYANTNGSLLHLFGVSDSNLTMAPNYRTW